MQEAGIPIDRIAGVSIGSFVGGLWAMERNVAQMTVKTRDFADKMSQKSQIYLDLTFPVSAKLTGIGFNKFLQQTFGDILIEDLWIPYFNITADVSVCKMRVHDFGCLWRYVRYFNCWVGHSFLTEEPYYILWMQN